MTNKLTIPGSFRDPSGFLFRGPDGVLYRQVNRSYEADFEAFKSIGLYDVLVKSDLLVPHEEVSLDLRLNDDAVAIIRPNEISFIAYPYEWCFAQLKDAALLTLDIQKQALNKGMVLKDASAYNVQFRGSRPVFIDTLSFERYTPGSPWVAYKQFCQHFLAPIALMTMVDHRLRTLLRSHIDGIPLDLASHLLPTRSRLKPGLLMHIHLHARTIQQNTATPESKSTDSSGKLSKHGLLGIVDSLESTIRSLTMSHEKSEWFGYADSAPYAEEAERQKKHIIEDFVGQTKPVTVWDLGANTGRYTEIATEAGAKYGVAMEFDHSCVNAAYVNWNAKGVTNRIPICMDLTNPSPSLGWAHTERDSVVGRGPADMVMALALIHHICISNNVPLSDFAAFIASVGRHAIVEFVGKEDPMVEFLLSSREDVFPTYTKEGFEAAFSERFTIVESLNCGEAHRTIYLLKRREE